MTEQRVEPLTAKRWMDEEGALLVAIYRGESFMRNFLEGAISYDEFEEQHLPQLGPDRKVIFY